MHRRKFLASAAIAMTCASMVAVDAAAAPPEGGREDTYWSSNFNYERTGWVDVTGTWTLRPGALTHRGIAGKRTSVKHVSNYANFGYQVTMRRRFDAASSAANAVTRTR